MDMEKEIITEEQENEQIEECDLEGEAFEDMEVPASDAEEFALGACPSLAREAEGELEGGNEISEESDEEGSRGTEEEGALVSELEQIRGEITKLKDELAKLDELKQRSEKMLREFDEFVELFPEDRIENLPDEVWDQVRSGASLSAAYALYEKKRAARERFALQVNQKNAALSAGSAGQDAASEYFTYEQVSAMSQAEVRKNYQKIRESMKKWN